MRTHIWDRFRFSSKKTISNETKRAKSCTFPSRQLREIHMSNAMNISSSFDTCHLYFEWLIITTSIKKICRHACKRTHFSNRFQIQFFPILERNISIDSSKNIEIFLFYPENIRMFYICISKLNFFNMFSLSNYYLKFINHFPCTAYII